MPSIITHHIHGEQVKKQLGSINAAAFAWGVQGPDFFYAQKPGQNGSSLKKYGSAFHSSEPNRVISSMKKGCGDYEMNRSYLLGFCCHYALDSAAHPYVLDFVNKLKAENPDESEISLHNEIESAIDTIMLRRECGKLPTEINLADYLPLNDEVQNTIAALYRFVIKDVFGDEVSKEAVLKAMEDAMKFHKSINDKSGLKKGLLKKLGNPMASNIRPMIEDASRDYANIEHAVWAYKDGRECDMDFFEVFDKAVQKAVNIINGLEEADISAYTENEPFC